MLSSVVLVEILEYGRASGQAILIIGVPHGDPGDEHLDTCRLWFPKLRLLEVDVMHDSADRAEGWIAETEPLDENLERAAIALMSELRFEHVEAQLTLLGLITFGRHELEPRARIDEAADEPGARHAVDMDALARHPDATTDALQVAPGVLHGRVSFAGGIQTRLQGGENRVRGPLLLGAEEVDRHDLGEAAPQACKRGLCLCAPLAVERAGGGEPGNQLPCLVGDATVVIHPRGAEECLDLVVREALDEAGFANGCFSALPDDLLADPLKVLLCLIAPRKDIDGILDADGAQALQPAPDLHTQIVRLGRDRMDQQEPARLVPLRQGCSHETDEPILGTTVSRFKGGV